MINSLKFKWWEYHKQNPHVYDLVERFTFDIIKRGYKNYSINSVFERIRWHTDVETEGESLSYPTIIVLTMHVSLCTTTLNTKGFLE